MEFGWLDIEAEEAKLKAIRQSATKFSEMGVPLNYWQLESIDERFYPQMSRYRPQPSAPPEGVAFSVGINEKFVPGLECLLISMKEFMPGLKSAIYVFHDGLKKESVRRLNSIYGKLTFMESDMLKMGSVPVSSLDQKRIGILGYMNAEALKMDWHDAVVFLEADVLFLGGAEGLWDGCDFYRLAPHCDTRPYSPISKFTKRTVLNSSVVVAPKNELGEGPYEEFKDTMKKYCGWGACPHMDRFNNQKIWNIYLKDRQVDIMPPNLNCSSRYLASFHGGMMEDVSVIHFPGIKPWENELDKDERVRWASRLWREYRNSRIS